MSSSAESCTIQIPLNPCLTWRMRCKTQPWNIEVHHKFRVMSLGGRQKKYMSQLLCTITHTQKYITRESETGISWSYTELKKPPHQIPRCRLGEGAFPTSISPDPTTPPVEDNYISLPHWRTGIQHRIGANFQMHFIRILASLVPWKPRKENFPGRQWLQ